MRAPLLVLILASSLVLMVATAGFLMLRGSGAGTLAGALPDDTMLALHLRRPDEVATALERMAAEDALVSGGWDAAADALTRQARRFGIETAFTARDAKALLDRNLILAILPGGSEKAGESSVLCARVGPAAEAVWARLIAGLQETALASQAVVTQRRHRGHEFLRVRGESSRNPLCLALWRDVVIATDSADAMRRCLDAADERARSLGDLPAYRRLQKRLGWGSGAQDFVWSSPAGLPWLAHRLAENDSARERWDRAATMLGLDAATGAGASLSFEGGGAREQMLLLIPGAGTGLIQELFAEAPRLRPAEGFPAAPARLSWRLSASVAHLDALYERLPDLIAAAGSMPRKEVRERLSGLEDLFAANPRETLLPAFGSRIDISFGGSAGIARQEAAPLPAQAVVRLTLRHRDVIEGALKRLDGLARAAGATRSEADAAGATITSFDVAAWRPLNPAWSLSSRQLLIGSSAELVNEVIAAGRGARGQEAPLPEAHAWFSGDSGRLINLLAGTPSPEPGALGDLLAALRARADDAALPPSLAAARMSDEGLLVDWRAPLPASLLAFLRVLQPIPTAPETPRADQTEVGAAEGQTPACLWWPPGL